MDEQVPPAPRTFRPILPKPTLPPPSCYTPQTTTTTTTPNSPVMSRDRAQFLVRQIELEITSLYQRLNHLEDRLDLLQDYLYRFEPIDLDTGPFTLP